MTEQTTPVQWHAANTGSHQGLIIDETTGANIAVTYNAEHAPFIVTACNSHVALVEALNDIVGAFAKARTMRAPAGHYDEDIYYNGIDLHAQIENAREALRMAQG